MEALFVAGTAIDVNSFAAQWKSMDETAEVSVVIKGIDLTHWIVIFLTHEFTR